jgi:hypothetical protein
LSLQHVQYTVDCTESACPAATCTAMNQYGSLTCGFGALVAKVVTATRPRYFVALLYQFDKVGRLGSGSEVGPMRILQLRYLPNGLEGKGRVREGEMSNKNERRFVTGLVEPLRGRLEFSGSRLSLQGLRTSRL